MDRESGKKTIPPNSLSSRSLSLSSLTRKKGPDPGWTELGRACRRGAGQGHGTWGHRRDGLGTGQEEYLGRVGESRVEGAGRRKPRCLLTLLRPVIQRFDLILENSTGQDKVQGSPDQDGQRTGFLREWAKWAANGPEAQRAREGVTGARVQRRN